jgi:hypothetical protein
MEKENWLRFDEEYANYWEKIMEYKIDKEEIENGDYIITREVVKDPEGNTVSRSDKCYVFPHPKKLMRK